MNYYTPELIEMGRSADDDVLDEQDRLWGEAGERYRNYLEQVRASFPKGVRRLFSRYYLHDSSIQRIGQNDRFFSIELQLDTPPRSFLTFRYRLLRPAQVNKEALPPACRSKGAAVHWLYAEIEQLSREEVLGSATAATWVRDEWLAQADGFDRGTEATWPFWVHRILLSNGWELTLWFHDVEVHEYEPLLGTPVNGMQDARERSPASA
jgi:hypothetical protein